MGKKFGTDGLRGKAGTVLTPEIAFELGMAAASVLTNNSATVKPTILIGKDTRISGDMLESALTAGITAVGVNVILLGIIPTPGVAALCRELNADAGVVISASHNPYYDNGIKFFSGTGYKLPDCVEEEIEVLLDDPSLIKRAVEGNIGCISRFDNAQELYSQILLKQQQPNLHGMKIAMDCANGAAAPIAGKLLASLGAELHIIGDDPNGININADCGSTHMEALQKLVSEIGAVIGLAFDGDADRFLAVDENGEIADGDFLLAIVAAHLREKELLEQNRVVVTQMSNLGLRIAMEQLGIIVEETKVGDRYVLEKMQETKAVVGGEQSGHLIFSHYNSTGDGLAAALKILSIMVESGKKLSELMQIMERLPQVLVNVKVSHKNGWEDDDDIMAAISQAEAALAGCGRVLLRPSGTEQVIRVMAEGRDQEELHRLVAAITLAVENKMN